MSIWEILIQRASRNYGNSVPVCRSLVLHDILFKGRIFPSAYVKLNLKDGQDDFLKSIVRLFRKLDISPEKEVEA